MIGISRKTDYAIRCMIHLAKEDRLTTLDQIACETNTPQKFITKALQEISKKGLVRSYRGKYGGVILSRRPEEITLLDVVEAIDGPVVPHHGISAKHAAGTSDNAVYPVWGRVQTLVRDHLQRITLRDLVTDNVCLSHRGKP